MCRLFDRIFLLIIEDCFECYFSQRLGLRYRVRQAPLELLEGLASETMTTGVFSPWALAFFNQVGPSISGILRSRVMRSTNFALGISLLRLLSLLKLLHS